VFRRADVLLERIRSGIWPLPLAMMLAGVVIFRLMLVLDATRPDPALLRTWWLYSGTGDDARNLLSTLVSAMITMASLVFSITVVALSLAASQFGSRLVRSYVRDAKSKLTLGMFAMTILYCLLGLRAVGTETPAEQVPHLTVSLGLLLSVVCVFAMLLFLHMVAHAIVADEVVRRVAADLEESIACLPRRSEGVPAAALRGEMPPTRLPVLSDTEGYVEAIRYGHLLGRAQAEDAFVNLHLMAGQFVARGDLIATYAKGATASGDFAQEIRHAVLVGPERTPVQDLAFSTRHLVDVALRALSAAINDANTALVVIDRLRGAFTRLLRRELPSGLHFDTEGVLRVAGPRHSHADHIHNALHAIRHSAAAQPVVVITLVEALTKLMPHAHDDAMRTFLLHQAQLAAQAGLAVNEDAYEHDAIGQALARAREVHGMLSGSG
jgi:uncharacterized membrane protein